MDPVRSSDSEPPASVPNATDALIGIGIDVFRLARQGTEAIIKTARPVAAFALRPPIIPQQLWPATAFTAAAERGRRERLAVEQYIVAMVHVLVPRVIEGILNEIDLTAMVIDHVDLDTAVAAVDIDAVAARLDLNAVVDRVPIDRVIDRVDIDSVADRLDLDRAVERLDLDAVIAHADVDGVVSRVDVDAVIGRVDLVGLARMVLDELDLPEIIRQSTGSMASDTIRSVRMASLEADQKITRAVDRFRPHRRQGNNPDRQSDLV